MFSRMKGQKGFTLIELMIVVAIIGILAAIAIPNFLQYQMKARQTEARTNTMGIKTSMVSYAGTAGCIPSLPVAGTRPVGVPSAAKQAWGVPIPLIAGLCSAGPPVGPVVGGFDDIGFVPSGNVFYLYQVNAVAGAAALPLTVGQAAAVGPNRNACNNVAPGAPAAVLGAAGFQVYARGNLDGDALISYFSADDGTGATDCTPGIF